MVPPPVPPPVPPHTRHTHEVPPHEVPPPIIPYGTPELDNFFTKTVAATAYEIKSSVTSETREKPVSLYNRFWYNHVFIKL